MSSPAAARAASTTPLGVALSQIYAKALPNAKVSVQSTKASAENLNLLQAGRGEIAFTLADALPDAWKGDRRLPGAALTTAPGPGSSVPAGPAPA